MNEKKRAFRIQRMIMAEELLKTWQGYNPDLLEAMTYSETMVELKNKIQREIKAGSILENK